LCGQTGKLYFLPIEMLSIAASGIANVMSGVGGQHFVPSADIVTSIVLPTIIFCIGMVIAMLIGINKCKQWELNSRGKFNCL
jgi:hypothetical protein